MTLKSIEDNGTCSWCGKTLEVGHVTFADNTRAALCWADLKRMAKLKLPSGKAEDKPDLRVQAG